MISLVINNRQIIFRKLIPGDFERLTEYLQNLSPETKKRFGPHPFDRQSVEIFYANDSSNSGYIAIDAETEKVIAYSILKSGYLEHDRLRLQSYGLELDYNTDSTFAPSVADEWQSKGIGNSLFLFILRELQFTEIKRIILWGGVQSNNEKAVNFYTKHGFRILGEFEYHGMNLDMLMEIT